MQNYEQDGEVVTVAAPSGGVTSGDFVAVGSLTGVAQETAAEGDPVAIVRRGIFELGKTSAQAWTVGAKIYATSGGEMTTSASGNTLVGVAAEAAANPSDTGKVLLTGQVV